MCVRDLALDKEGNRKVMDLREGEDNVSVKVRVLSAGEPKVIHTRRGDRTISEAIVGDDTGRVKLTIWGSQTGKVDEGDAIEINGGWTTSFRGEVQLNVGFRGEIKKIGEDEVPTSEEVPEDIPKASNQGFRSYGRKGSSSFRRYKR